MPEKMFESLGVNIVYYDTFKISFLKFKAEIFNTENELRYCRLVEINVNS